MKSIAIGIYLDQSAERADSTLASLRANTSGPYRCLPLENGQIARSSTDSGVATLRADTTSGPAAAFNRLLNSGSADLYIFLEAGCVAGPGWLDLLVAALDSDPRNGLAGPSTNRAWNQQCVFPGALGNLDAVGQTARTALHRFGSACRTLEPLYSLSDFCYAVTAEVVEKIGAADEQYGLGPCWEMDYNIRAQRAGFRGVWACASYVYRTSFSARRALQEKQHFQQSRERYQDKFCGLRLSGISHSYKSHCRGDVCEHFAPRARVQLHNPFAPDLVNQIAPVPPASEQPLVSCIMATRDRPDFVMQSIRYFQRQDYPNRELIILHDGHTRPLDCVDDDPRIRWIATHTRQSIGAKRNRGCELAHGAFIAHWDDDDWYAPDRLSLQLAPLLRGDADISGLQADIFFDLPAWKFWQCTPSLHRRLFVEDVHGGTLVYRRDCWGQRVRYPDISLAEDALFLRTAIHHGARLLRLPNNRTFIYLRHHGNAWSFECGKYLDPHGWQLTTEPELPPQDRTFYATKSPSVLPSPLPSKVTPRDQPLVSCIMPTANRRFLIPRAIGYFLNQDYPNRELLIIDDGEDSIADQIPSDPRIRYLRLPQRQTIGAKRNFACEQAHGSIIAHWDDDDWIAGWRLSYQVNALSQRTGNAVCGLTNILYYEPAGQRAWFYVYPERQRRWLAGNTLCYHKDLWRLHPFSPISEGEDTRFIWSLPDSCILPLSDHTFYVATVHRANSSPKRTRDVRWLPHPVDEIKTMLGKDFPFYEAWPEHDQPGLQMKTHIHPSSPAAVPMLRGSSR
jgi:O-antigen biosynthesis protein